MATSSIYYIDSTFFSAATAVYIDAELSTKASDGYYSFNDNNRQQISGFLGSIVACPSATTLPNYFTLNYADSCLSACTSGLITFNTVSTGGFTAPYTGVAIAPNGDAYATILQSWSAFAGGTGFIYERPNTGTTFNGISAPDFAYNGIAVNPSGDVYAIAYAQSIFKQTGGIGSWTPILGQDYKHWTGICSATNGDMYACESQYGTIYRKLAGETTFNTPYYTHTIDTPLTDITISPSGDIYICTSSDIYKQTGGVGSFVALGATGQTWTGLSAAPNGKVFACSEDTPSTDGDIFVQYGGTGSFISLNQVNRDWSGIAFENNFGYATVSGGYVYRITF